VVLNINIIKDFLQPLPAGALRGLTINNKD